MEGLILAIGTEAIYKGKTYVVSKELHKESCYGCSIGDSYESPCWSLSVTKQELLNTLGHCAHKRRTIGGEYAGVIFVEKKTQHINFMEE
jgi:hypothetical protein